MTKRTHTFLRPKVVNKLTYNFHISFIQQRFKVKSKLVILTIQRI